MKTIFLGRISFNILKKEVMKHSILLISLFITTIAFSQVEYIRLDAASMEKRAFFDDISVGISLNHSLLRGDAYGLSDQFQNEDFSLDGSDKFDWGFGVRVAGQISRYFDAGLEFNMSNMTGVKNHETNKNYNTRESDIDYVNFNLTSRFYFSKFITRKIRRPIVLGYLDVSAGVLFSHATTKNVSEGIANFPEQVGNDNDVSALFGFGGGMEVRVFKNISFDLGTKILFSSSDEVDGIYNGDITSINQSQYTDQNEYNDVFWISHVGFNVDLARSVDNSVSRKWHLGDIRPDELLAEELERANGGPHSVDTLYINSRSSDTIYVFNYDTLVRVADNGHNLTPVYFDTESSIVKNDQIVAIENAVKYLEENPKATLTLNGYTDERGKDDYNLALSKDRVESVKKILTNVYNIDDSRIKESHHGENHMKLESNSLNRRVDLFVK